MFTICKKFLSFSSYCTNNIRGMNKIINEAKSLFLESMSAVESRTLIRNNVTVKDNKLCVCEKEFAIDKNCYVVGFGKAVFGMATEMESILGGHLVNGIVSIPSGLLSSCADRFHASSGLFHNHNKNSREKFDADKCIIMRENLGIGNSNKPVNIDGQKDTNCESKMEYIDTWRNLHTGNSKNSVNVEGEKERNSESKITVFEGADNNLPDAAAERAAKAIFELAGRLSEKDVLIVLISGGGSALLPLPRAPVTLEQKTALIKLLSRRGADILELNSVRTRLSQIKGGGLALQAYPAKVVALILSDVIGDPIHYIASGPTTEPRDLPETAASIIRKYDLQVPDSVRRMLSDSEVKPRGCFTHVTNLVIGNNARAAAAAEAAANRLGYESHVMSGAVSGDVRAVSAAYARLAIAVARRLSGLADAEHVRRCVRDYNHILHVSDAEISEICNTSGRRVCLVAGGEPIVRVLGNGTGGRNQQLALQFAIDVNNALQSAEERVKAMNISLLSCGTDGMDGPTDAAGAVGTNSLCALAQQHNLNPLDYLRDNDCYTFYRQFENGQYLIRTGHTGTNVMDIHLLMIDDKN